MKDIVITARRIRCEVILYVVCFVLAFSTNVYAVIAYDRPWVELFSQIGFVVVISVAFYVLLAVVRVLLWGLYRLVCCPRRKKR